MNTTRNPINIFAVDRRINIKMVVRIGTANVIRRRGFSSMFPNNRRQYGKLREKKTIINGIKNMQQCYVCRVHFGERETFCPDNLWELKTHEWTRRQIKKN